MFHCFPTAAHQTVLIDARVYESVKNSQNICKINKTKPFYEKLTRKRTFCVNADRRKIQNIFDKSILPRKSKRFKENTVHEKIAMAIFSSNKHRLQPRKWLKVKEDYIKQRLWGFSWRFREFPYSKLKNRDF